jgi:hypothetical protein
MLHKLAALLFLTAFLAVPVFADVTVVSDNFESYADNAAMQAQWVSTIASTTSTFLFDQTTPGQPYPVSPTIGATQGKAVIFDGTLGVGAGSINKWATPFSVAPSATQNVQLTVDLAHDGLTSNKKLTMGLRYTGASAENLIELGFWNQLTGVQFAHRTVLFPGSNGWAGYGLDPTMDMIWEMPDTIEPLDGAAGRGAGFHRYQATISLTDVTFTLDLFSDGINNKTGLPGVDATDVVAGATVTANGFNDLRFGIPSGSGSSADPFLGVDNVSLKLVDIAVPTQDADFNNSTLVDGADFLIWQRGFGTPDAQNADGDADGDPDVDAADLTIWNNQYGAAPPVLAAVTAVPEPTSLALAAVALLFAARRSRVA